MTNCPYSAETIYATEEEMQEEYDEQMRHFCTDCGARMILKKVLKGYNPNDGEPHYQLEGKCPNGRWWKDGHYTELYEMPVVRKVKQMNWGTMP